MFAADPKAVSVLLPDSLGSATMHSWKHIIDPVEPFLDTVNRRLCEQVAAFDPEVAPYADYALNGQGKHLRPALVALTASALGEIQESHVSAAVIIEMIHLATLVHDDVMDEAEIRRGRLTLASQWGVDIAVLFGDCLFGRALTLAADFPTTHVCRAVATATNTVCTGEILQTRSRSDFGFTREKYFKVLEMKTAELFALSCELAAYLSGASAAQQAELRRFGLAFGTAYQIYDDCLDAFGSEALAGKSVGNDLANGKLTLPVLLAYEKATSPERARLERIVQDVQPEGALEVSGLLAKYGSLEGSVETMHGYLAQARQALMTLPESEGRNSLANLTGFLTRQAEALGARTLSSL